jgi:organic hydroperoxide reductase OsmC/OhrA
MQISAKTDNALRTHSVTLTTESHETAITIAPRRDGYGSSANGGELLCLALATCYTNDIYREARKRGISVQRVEVDVRSEFNAEGAAATQIQYSARVTADASQEKILDLIAHTDTVAEIQNTLRQGIAVKLIRAEAQPAQA